MPNFLTRPLSPLALGRAVVAALWDAPTGVDAGALVLTGVAFVLTGVALDDAVGALGTDETGVAAGALVVSVGTGTAEVLDTAGVVDVAAALETGAVAAESAEAAGAVRAPVARTPTAAVRTKPRRRRGVVKVGTEALREEGARARDTRREQSCSCVHGRTTHAMEAETFVTVSHRCARGSSSCNRGPSGAAQEHPPSGQPSH